MHVDERIDLLVRLGAYMNSDDDAWQAAQRKAFAENHWFIPEFITLSVHNIVQQFLQYEVLKKLVETYQYLMKLGIPKK